MSGAAAGEQMEPVRLISAALGATARDLADLDTFLAQRAIRILGTHMDRPPGWLSAGQADSPNQKLNLLASVAEPPPPLSNSGSRSPHFGGCGYCQKSKNLNFSYELKIW